MLLLTLILPPIPAVAYYADMYDVNPDVIRAIVWVESCDDPRAVGGSGEQGYAQIMPGTADYIAASTDMRAAEILNNPTVNIRAGTWLFSIWYHRFERVDLALSAYNAGAKYVIEHGVVNPITKNYVDKVYSVLGWHRGDVCIGSRCIMEVDR